MMFERLRQWIDRHDARSANPSAPSAAPVTPPARPGTTSARNEAPRSLADVSVVFANGLLRPPREAAAPTVPGPLERTIYAEVLKVLKTGVTPDSLPGCPGVITRLLEVLHSENSTYHDVVALVEQEPLVATEVIKVANTPLFRPKSGEVTSLEVAAQLLGMRQLAAVVSTVLMKRIFNIKPIYFKMFGKYLWEHSQQCAVASRYLAKRAGEDEFTAYLVGLLHDIGKLVIFQELLNALRDTHPGVHPNAEMLAEIIHETAAQLSCVSLKHWQMPVAIQSAICEQARVTDPEKLSSLGYILYAANILSEIWLLRQQDLLDDGGARRLLGEHGLDAALLDDIFSVTKAD